MLKQGKKLTKTQIDRLMKDTDADGDGQISYDEFFNSMVRTWINIYKVQCLNINLSLITSYKINVCCVIFDLRWSTFNRHYSRKYRYYLYFLKINTLMQFFLEHVMVIVTCHQQTT